MADAPVSVGPTTIVAPAGAPAAAPAGPKITELPKPAGANALANALKNLKTDLADGTVKITDVDAPIIEAFGEDAHEEALAKQKAEADAPADIDAPAADDAVVAEPQRPEGAYQDAAGRWRSKDGKYLPNDPAAAAAKAEAKPDAAADAPAEAATLVKIPGREGQEDLEIEVSDPAIAERLNELRNNGMRKAEFTRRLEPLEQRESEMQSLELRIKSTPVEFLLERVKPETQLEVAKALVAAHWDALYPTLNQWAQDGTGVVDRRTHLVDVKENNAKSRDEFQRAQFAQRESAGIVRAVKALVPDTIAGSDTERRFVHAAEQELLYQLHEKKIRPTKDNVAELLAPVLRDFRFDSERAAPDALAAAPGTAPRAAAAPAKAPAANAGKPAAKMPANAAAIATQRATARRIAPPGAGAIPAQVPQLPKSENPKNALKDAFKHFRANPGQLRTTSG